MNLEERLTMALRQDPVSELDVEFVYKKVVSFILEVIFLAGYKTPAKEDVALLARKLTNDLMEDFGFYRIEEVSICFDLGLKGSFGEIKGINYRTLIQWLQKYRTHDTRVRVLRKIHSASEAKALPPVSEEYNNQCARNVITDSFIRYKKNKNAFMLTTFLFEQLQKLGYVQFSAQDRLDALNCFCNWRPTPEQPQLPKTDKGLDYKYKAQAWLVKRYFDSIDKLPMT